MVSFCTELHTGALQLWTLVLTRLYH